MDPIEEKKLLLDGIDQLREQLIYLRGARCLEVLERLESLRLCLESLIRTEIKSKQAYKNVV